MVFTKAFLGLIVGAGAAFGTVASGVGCMGSGNTTPTPAPTATPTATPAPKLASATVTVAAKPGPYTAGFTATFVLSFTPAVAGKACTVTAVAAKTNDYLSIDVSATKAATLPAGSGLYSTKAASTSNTATLKLTPPDTNTLNVYVADFTGWGGLSSGSVTVTVTQ